MNFSIYFLSWLVLFSLTNCARADEISGKVESVPDGDSLTLLKDDKTQVRVRLEGIDAPEMKQAFGGKAKQVFSDLVLGKTIKLVITGKDNYGRVLGNVYVGETWINLELVKSGFAWHFAKYNKDERLKEAEQTARKGRAGLWKDDAPTSPWDWRAANKSTEVQDQ